MKLHSTIILILVVSQCNAKISDVIKNFSEDGISQECLQQLDIVTQNVSVFWRLVDASSKYPISGMSYGSNKDYGNFDECITLNYETSKGNVMGKYCPFSLAVINPILKPVPDPFAVNTEPKAAITYTNNLQIPRAFREDVQVLVTMLSLCIPDACTPKEVGEYFAFGNVKIENISLINVVDSMPCVTKDSNADYQAKDIVFITFLSLILLLMVCSTVYDYVIQKLDKEASHPLYLAFSVLTNGKKLLHTSNGNPEQIQCLSGMRFISMMWVIAGHGFGIAEQAPLTNYATLKDYQDDIKVQYVASAPIAVDTFFVISGFLLTYGYLKASMKLTPLKQAKGVPMMYCHRYLRLTPALGVLFWFVVTVWRKLGSGPLWSMTIMFNKNCEKYWWSFFLYIQNYVNYDTTDLCISPTWYLSADMQMFLLAPLVLIPVTIFIKKDKTKLVLMCLGCLTAICVVIPMIVEFSDETYNNSYSTHARLNDYLIGIILGVILRQYKKFPFTKRTNLIIWCCVLIIDIAFNLYYHDVLRNPDHTKTVLYSALYKPIWCVSVAWMIYSCYHGYGGPINWFLSLPAFQIGGRLSYCMYLLHFVVEMYWMGTFNSAFYWSDYTIFYNWCGHFIITMVLSLFWTLAFESPMIVIERFLFGNINKKKPPQKQEQA